MRQWRLEMGMFKGKADRHEALDAAVSEWRARMCDESCGLSNAARHAILRSAVDHDAVRPAGLAHLFTPAHRWVLAGVLPALLLAAALGFLGRPWDSASGALDPAGRPMHATKLNGEVVFVIANGHRAHNVYTSTDPHRFSGDPTFVTRSGSFSDSLRNGPDLVFYRID